MVVNEPFLGLENTISESDLIVAPTGEDKEESIYPSKQETTEKTQGEGLREYLTTEFKKTIQNPIKPFKRQPLIDSLKEVSDQT